MIIDLILVFLGSIIFFSLLIPKPQIEDAKAQEFSEDGFPKATENSPIPYLIGKTKLESPNTLFAGNFRTVALTERVKTGLFSKKTVIVGYQYFLTMDLGFCLGDTLNGVTLHQIVIDDVVVWSGSIRDDGGGFAAGSISSSDLFGGAKNGGGFVSDFRFYPGTFTQPKDSYIDGLADSGGLQTPYRGVCHVVFQDAYIGETPRVRTVSIVGSRFTNRLGLAGGTQIINGETANWAESLYDVIVNQYGGLNADPDTIDALEFFDVAAICVTEGQGVGGVIQGATNGENIIKQYISQMDALLTINPATNLVQPKLLRRDYDAGTLPVFGPESIMEVSKYSQTMWAELVSEVKTGFKNPENNYQDTTAVAQDLAVASITGKLRSTNISLPFVKDRTLANTIAGRELNQLSQIVTQVTFKANRKFYKYRPGEVFKWSWPDYNITEMILRVKEVKDGNDNDPLITVEAVRDTYDNTSNPFAIPNNTSAITLTSSPVEIATSAFFGAPEFMVLQLAGNTDAIPLKDDPTVDYIHALAIPADVVSVSFDGLIDDVDTMFTDAIFPTSGVLNTAIDKLDAFSTTVIASIELLNMSDVTSLNNGGTAAIRAGQQLLRINDEIMGYSSFTDNGGGSVTLTGVYRALLNTLQVDHIINDRVYFLEASTTSESLTLTTDSPASIKLMPSTGPVKLSPIGVSATNYTVQGAIAKPDPPDYSLVDGLRVSPELLDGANITVTWRARDKSLGTVQIISDAADTEPANTTYNLYVFNLSVGGGAIYSQLGIVGTTHNFTMPIDQIGGVLEIRTYAVRDGLISINYDFIQVQIEASIRGNLFQNTNSFYGGQFGASAFYGALFENTNTFYGNEFVPIGVINGALFQNTNSFYVGKFLDPNAIQGTLFSNTNSFYGGLVTIPLGPEDFFLFSFDVATTQVMVASTETTVLYDLVEEDAAGALAGQLTAGELTIPLSLNGKYASMSAGVDTSAGRMSIEASTDSGVSWISIGASSSQYIENSVMSGVVLLSTGDMYRVRYHTGSTPTITSDPETRWTGVILT